MNTKNTLRNTAVDIIKSIAILGVIIIHTCSGGYFYPVKSADFGFTVFWGSISRAAVPLFLMCSGALMLPREKALSIKKLYTKNILRLLIAMLFWAMAYKIYHLLATDSFSAANLFFSFKEVLLFKQEFHLYYIHIMFLVYAFLPVTRSFVSGASELVLYYFLAVWFAGGILYPTLRIFRPINLIGGIPAQYYLNMTYTSIGYGILGYILNKKQISLRTGFTLTILGFLSVFLPTYFMSVKNGYLFEHFLEGMSVGVCMFACGIFILGKHFSEFAARSKKISAVFTHISKASFCIYLIHVFVIYLFEKIGFVSTSFPTILSIPCISVCNLAICFLIYIPLSKLPLVKKWLI